MDFKCCNNCEYYHRHYVKYKCRRYLPADCGHCFYPRVKFRRPEDVCDKFVQRKKG